MIRKIEILFIKWISLKVWLVFLIPFILIVTSSLYISSQEKIVIGILPFEGVSKKEILAISKSVENYYNLKVVVLPKYKTPKKSFFNTEDTIKALDYIDFLRTYVISDTNCDFIIGVTSKPIILTSDDTTVVIRGLGQSSISVISTSRIKTDATDKQQYLKYLSKVGLHECGHMFGLEHCLNNGKCFMIGINFCTDCPDDVKYGLNDIKKLYSTDDRLCPNCQAKLKKRIDLINQLKKLKREGKLKT